MFVYDLWGDVEGTACIRQIFIKGMVLDAFRESEICQFEDFVMDKDVLGFDVTMQQASIIEHLIPFAELSDDVPDLLFRQQCRFLYEFFEGPLVAILHDDVEVVLALNTRFNAVDKVLMPGQFPDHFELCLDGLLVVGFEKGDDLDD